MTSQSASLPPVAPVAPAWRMLLPLTAVTLLLLLGSYWTTVSSIVAIWYRSETFAHGFVIAPISLWLIWRIRAKVLALAPQPSWLGLLVLLACSLLWGVAELAQVGVVAQFALVAMLPATVWALLGNRVAASIAFPLLYLLLMVPAGEVFLLPMMNFTADFTVAALRLSGIPVYREGLSFVIPSGNWSVVEACSGLRYLIASGTLGLLYAYLNYQSALKRALFIMVSLLLPILANGVRAYMIVMLGHLSGMKLAVGVDHLIYGWVFFGIVMLALFWIGSHWRDPDPDWQAEAAILARSEHAAFPLWWGVPLLLALLAGLGVTTLLARPYVGPPPSLQPNLTAPWQQQAPGVSDPRPAFALPATSLQQVWSNGDARIGMYLAAYSGAAGEGRLVTSTNTPFQAAEERAWQLLEQTVQPMPIGSVKQSLVRGPGGKWLLQQFYLIDGEQVANDYRAKWLQLRSHLLGRHGAGVAVVAYAPADDALRAEAQLAAFWQQQYRTLAASVAHGMQR